MGSGNDDGPVPPLIYLFIFNTLKNSKSIFFVNFNVYFIFGEIGQIVYIENIIVYLYFCINLLILDIITPVLKKIKKIKIVYNSEKYEKIKSYEYLTCFTI